MASSQISKQLMCIGGRWCHAQDNTTYAKLNPYTGETISQVAAGKRQDARLAVEVDESMVRVVRGTRKGRIWR